MSPHWSMSVVPHPSSRAFADVADALAALAAGELIVVVDGEPNAEQVTAALVMAADKVAAADIEFIAVNARGWTCIALEAERCDQLGLEPLDGPEGDGETGLTVTIAARDGLTHHVSPGDLAHTMRVAADANKGTRDIVKGGHVSPVRAQRGGLFTRSGLPEAAVDLARLAGCAPAGVLCPLDGSDETTTRERVAQYCERHALKHVSLAGVVAYRGRYDRLVERVAETRLPTTWGEFTAVGYEWAIGDGHSVALVNGDVRGAGEVLVKIHPECLTGDVFGSLRCECAAELRAAMERISAEGGVVVYLSRDRATSAGWTILCREGGDVHWGDGDLSLGRRDHENQEYAITTQILRDLGLSSVRLLTSRVGEAELLQRYGVEVTEELSLSHAQGVRRAAKS